MDQSKLTRLLSEIADQDQDAMNQLYEYAWTPLLRFFLRLSPSRDDAEDLVQNTFLKVWTYRGKFRENGKARAYLYQIALNEWRTLSSSQIKRRDLFNELTAAPDASALQFDDNSSIGLAELKKKVREAVDTLPETQRETFVLHRFEGLCCREIAAATGRSQKTIESRLRLALGRITQKLSILEDSL